MKTIIYDAPSSETPPIPSTRLPPPRGDPDDDEKEDDEPNRLQARRPPAPLPPTISRPDADGVPTAIATSVPVRNDECDEEYDECDDDDDDDDPAAAEKNFEGRRIRSMRSSAARGRRWRESLKAPTARRAMMETGGSGCYAGGMPDHNCNRRTYVRTVFLPLPARARVEARARACSLLVGLDSPVFFLLDGNAEWTSSIHCRCRCTVRSDRAGRHFLIKLPPR